jgi:hypothetical protein
MKNSLTTSVPAFAAHAAALQGAVARQRGIAMTGAALGFSGAAFRVTDDVVPGLRVWSPPA